MSTVLPLSSMISHSEVSMKNTSRDDRIRAYHAKNPHNPVTDIMELFGVSRNTVCRALGKYVPVRKGKVA